MTVTDYAGVLGLAAAALVALWMLTGTRLRRAEPRHSAPPTDPRPAPPPDATPARHRASSSRVLQRLIR